MSENGVDDTDESVASAFRNPPLQLGFHYASFRMEDDYDFDEDWPILSPWPSPSPPLPSSPSYEGMAYHFLDSTLEEIMDELLLEKALDIALPETTSSVPTHATIEITEEPLPVPAPVRLQPPATFSFNPSPSSGPMRLTPEWSEWELIAEFVLEHDDKQIKMEIILKHPIG